MFDDGVKIIDFLEVITNSSFVLGFLPILSFLLTILKDPKFFKFSPPDSMFCIIISIKSLIYKKVKHLKNQLFSNIVVFVSQVC